MAHGVGWRMAQGKHGPWPMVLAGGVAMPVFFSVGWHIGGWYVAMPMFLPWGMAHRGRWWAAEECMGHRPKAMCWMQKSAWGIGLVAMLWLQNGAWGIGHGAMFLAAEECIGAHAKGYVLAAEGCIGA